MWHNKLAQAAFELSRGNTDAAEHALRETVSVGLLLVDDGLSVEPSIGASMASHGLDNLRLLYSFTNQPEKARLVSEGGGLYEQEAGFSVAGRNPASSVNGPDDFLEFVADERNPRAARWDVFSNLLPVYSCSSARGLLLGPPRDALERLNGPIRESMVRYESDQALFDMVMEWDQRSARRGPVFRSPLTVSESLLSFGWKIGRLVGNDRLAACYAMGLI